MVAGAQRSACPRQCIYYTLTSKHSLLLKATHERGRSSVRWRLAARQSACQRQISATPLLRNTGCC